jgi:integrase
VPLARLSPQQVQQLYATKLSTGLSATTVHHIHRTLRHALGEALRLGIVAQNVATLVRS